MSIRSEFEDREMSERLSSPEFLSFLKGFSENWSFLYLRVLDDIRKKYHIVSDFRIDHISTDPEHIAKVFVTFDHIEKSTNKTETTKTFVSISEMKKELVSYWD